jgi:hypothetical protein
LPARIAGIKPKAHGGLLVPSHGDGLLEYGDTLIACRIADRAPSVAARDLLKARQGLTLMSLRRRLGAKKKSAAFTALSQWFGGSSGRFIVGMTNPAPS